MQIKTIFLDLDGVLVNFVDGVFEKLKIKDWEVQSGEWDILKWKNVPKTFWRDFEQQLTAKDWADLKPYYWCEELFGLARKLVGKENVYILSSAGGSAEGVKGKIIWVKKYLSESQTHRVVLTPHKHFCAAPDRLLIDDSDKKINDFKDHGGKTCLLPRPWNQLHKTCLGAHHEINPVGYVKRYLVEMGYFKSEQVFG